MEGQEPRSLPQRIESSDTNYQYYLQYKKLYEQALGLSRGLKKMNKRQIKVCEHIAELASKAQEFKDTMRPDSEECRKKKNRRTADQMNKEFECPHERCEHRYGTESSLRVHIKKKHPELYEPRKRGKIKKEESVKGPFEDSS